MTGRPEVEAHIEAEGVVFADGDAALLRAVDEHGSLNAATVALGRSFAHAQRRIVELEAAFGSLVDRTRGGRGGGGSELTDRARDLLARLDRLEVEGTGLAEVDHTTLSGRVVERDGEIGTVETTAGRVRALVPPGAETVAVSVRSDAVTLHDQPGPEGSSALNRFRGTVVGVDRGEAIAVVALEVTPAVTVEALVTRESASRLDLDVGATLVATFKATATRAVSTSRVTNDDASASRGTNAGNDDADTDSDPDGTSPETTETAARDVGTGTGSGSSNGY